MKTPRADDARPISGGDRATLDLMVARPISHNLAWIDVVKMAGDLGQVEERANDAFVFEIGEEKLDIHKPHTRHLAAPELIELRHFATRAGLSPHRPSGGEAVADHVPPGLMLAVDHHQARIFHIDVPVGRKQHAISHYDPPHVLRNASHKEHVAAHRVEHSDNLRYFEVVAHAIEPRGKIVLVGHGNGEGNAAHQLAAYLRTHHVGSYERVVSELIADLPHLSEAELVEIGRNALERNESAATQ